MEYSVHENLGAIVSSVLKPSGRSEPPSSGSYACSDASPAPSSLFIRSMAVSRVCTRKMNGAFANVNGGDAVYYNGKKGFTSSATCVRVLSD
jgi:hypothetical protein